MNKKLSKPAQTKNVTQNNAPFCFGLPKTQK